MAPKGHNPSHEHHSARTQAAVRADNTSAEGAESAPVTASVKTEPAGAVPATITLPLSVVGRSDVSKALRELTSIDDYFHQAGIRGANAGEMPAVGRALDGLARANGLNMVHAEHRSALKEFLTKLKATAPVVHISFPSEPSDSFIAKILEWFRANVHQNVVLHVGMQPEIAAGAVVRTTNKLFDFSLRKKFDASKAKLIESISKLDVAAEKTVVADANATVQQEQRL